MLAGGVIPISHGIKAFYADKGMDKRRIFLLPILVDTDLYGEKVDQPVTELVGKDYFLNSGTFNEKDGINHLVAAFEVFSKQHQDFFLVFTGDGTEDKRKFIEAHLEDKALAGRVLFVGFLSQNELIWAYQNAKGLLSCRSNSEYANYGFPTKLGEYLSSGSPVIATRVGDVEKYLEDKVSAFIAMPESSDDIGAKLCAVADNVSHARNVGAVGLKVALDNFDYRQYGSQLAEFIASASFRRN
jgi:glycosyltransferase involved in cell wall biosynthesis